LCKNNPLGYRLFGDKMLKVVGHSWTRFIRAEYLALQGPGVITVATMEEVGARLDAEELRLGAKDTLIGERACIFCYRYVQLARSVTSGSLERKFVKASFLKTLTVGYEVPQLPIEEFLYPVDTRIPRVTTVEPSLVVPYIKMRKYLEDDIAARELVFNSGDSYLGYLREQMPTLLRIDETAELEYLFCKRLLDDDFGLSLMQRNILSCLSDDPAHVLSLEGLADCFMNASTAEWYTYASEAAQQVFKGVHGIIKQIVGAEDMREQQFPGEFMEDVMSRVALLVSALDFRVQPPVQIFGAEALKFKLFLLKAKADNGEEIDHDECSMFNQFGFLLDPETLKEASDLSDAVVNKGRGLDIVPADPEASLGAPSAVAEVALPTTSKTPKKKRGGATKAAIKPHKTPKKGELTTDVNIDDLIGD